jgi:5-formyltetrahydrofolate cyclo-ligase
MERLVDMTDEEIAAAKAALRQSAHVRRAGIAADFRADAALLACRNFFDGFNPGLDQVVSAYWPIGTEIDTKPLLIRLMDSGRTVALPVTEGDKPLVMRQWEQDTPLYPSGFGTLAPIESAPELEPDIVILPMLGFDKAGNRLGYGKGHYDRTIALMKKRPKLIGLAFASQEISAIASGPHDIPLDAVVTEAGVRHFDRINDTP